MRNRALIMCLLLPVPGDARESRTPCESACVQLAERIKREPTKLAMAIEDALVAHEACTSELISAAIDTVAAEPIFVREIWDTAVKVLPQRRAEIERTIRRFSVPRAGVFREPKIVVRRAQAPGAGRTHGLEVRRAEMASGDAAHEPLPEIRRAVIPERAETSEASAAPKLSKRSRRSR